MPQPLRVEVQIVNLQSQTKLEHASILFELLTREALLVEYDLYKIPHGAVLDDHNVTQYILLEIWEFIRNRTTHG